MGPSTWDVLRNTDAFLKAPITTPQGGGYKSLNVTVRTALGLYANVRPCVSYSPFVPTKHPSMDVVIVRENEEDLYAGIEYRPTRNLQQALKIISREGSERIIRYAFAFAEQQGRKKVTCFTKDNILKQTDGLFHSIFREVAKEYPSIESEHWIVDIGAAKLADTPELFDVIVLPNLYGDILSDVAAQIAGSVGLAGSANIGQHTAMFEAIHGSAPRQAGKNTANPSGLLLAAVMMCNDLGFPKEATMMHNAWLRTIEEGIHTYDLCRGKRESVGTQEFGQAVEARLGKKPESLSPVHYGEKPFILHKVPSLSLSEEKRLVGVDIFIDHNGTIETLVTKLQRLSSGEMALEWIANRGAIVWPKKQEETLCIDHWRCRYLSHRGIDPKQIVHFLGQLASADIAFTQAENLYLYDGKPGFSIL